MRLMFWSNGIGTETGFYFVQSNITYPPEMWIYCFKFSYLGLMTIG